jgi:hypothetical protein
MGFSPWQNGVLSSPACSDQLHDPPTSYTMDTRVSFIKSPETEVDPPPPSSAKVKEGRTCTCTDFPHIIMAVLSTGTLSLLTTSKYKLIFVRLPPTRPMRLQEHGTGMILNEPSLSFLLVGHDIMNRSHSTSSNTDRYPNLQRLMCTRKNNKLPEINKII